MQERLRIHTQQVAELKSYPFTLVGVDVEEAQKGMDKNDQTTCFIRWKYTID